MGQVTNQLAGETSPYLRQHASNPVDWFPWGEEAFERARELDRPVLLSVGYSTCHWCHVMAHESFEDDEIAEAVNSRFVAIKVDREERPDIDAIYMDAVVALTGSGGWPLTVFLTPCGQPFFGGTYFPRNRRGGMVSFPELLDAIDTLWLEHRGDVTNQATRLTTALRERIAPADSILDDSIPADSIPGDNDLEAATAVLVADADPVDGGFGTAPKFPQIPALEFLLERWDRTRDPALLAIVEHSADAMASGGIHDHIGGGFARYSVDRRWIVPHFEKMLYDQALGVDLFLHLWQITGRSGYLRVVENTIDFVLRDLRHRDGGFFCALDADSDGGEGSYYLWSPKEITEALDELGSDTAQAAIEWWRVTEKGNFEGRNILWHPGTIDDPLPDDLEEARHVLRARRDRRPRPALDDKIVLEWNALMIAALARAGAATGRADWTTAAGDAVEFVGAHLRDGNGRWSRAWPSQTPAFAVDHAALLDAFVRLGEATGQARWIAKARETADTMIALFWDTDAGGLFTVGCDVEQLVVRSKDLTDTPSPSANSLAALSLLRLGVLTGETGYIDRSEAIMRMTGPLAIRNPAAFAVLLNTIDLRSRGITEIAVTGERPDLVEVVTRHYLPSVVLAWGEPYESPLWPDSDGLAHVCRNYACQSPVADPVELTIQLGVER